MILKLAVSICGLFVLLFVNCLNCITNKEEALLNLHFDSYGDKSLNIERKKDNKKNLDEYVRFIIFFRYAMFPTIFNDNQSSIFSRFYNNCNNDTLETIPFVKYVEREKQEGNNKWKNKKVCFSNGNLKKKILLKIFKNTKTNNHEKIHMNSENKIRNHRKGHVENKSYENSNENIEEANEEDMISENMIKESKNICQTILNNPFDFPNIVNIYNSRILKLFKKPLENKKTGAYDLFVVGEMHDVSATILNESVNNITRVRLWNKFIKELNYVNISKEDILNRKKKKILFNVNDHLIKENNQENSNNSHNANTINTNGMTKYVYLVNYLPWPFKSHDVIYEKYDIYDKKKNMFLIINKSIDNLFMKNKNFARIKNFKHFLCIYPKTTDLSENGLKYVIYFYYNFDMPKYVQNHIFNQVIPSLIFNLYAFAQRESNIKKPLSSTAVPSKERLNDKLTTLGKEQKNNFGYFFQQRTVKEIKDTENENGQKKCMKNVNHIQKKEKEKENNTNKLYFTNFFFTKLHNLWKNKKKKMENLFFYFYYLF